MLTEEMFEKEHPFKLLMKFSIPAVIGMLVLAIYNVVDRIFIGNAPELGALGLAAATIASPVMMITGALGLWFANGGGTLFSIALGEKRKDKAESIQINAFFLSLAVGLIIATLGNIFINPILKLLGASDNVMPFAREYFSIVLFGSPFSCISMFGNNFSRAQGNPKNAMISMVFGAVFNIVFDYIFIMKLNMGMRGAAIATIGGQFLSAMYQLVFLYSKRSMIPMKFDIRKICKKMIARVATTGLPVFLVQAAVSLIAFVLNKQAYLYGGDIGLSTIAVASSILTLIQMPLSGLIQGQVPIMSYCYGSGDIKRIFTTLKYSIIVATGLMFLAFAIIMLATKQVVLAFNSDPVLLNMAVPALRIAFLALPVVGFQAMATSVFQATRQIKQASFLNLSRQILLLIPLVIILSTLFGFKGIFIAMPISDVLSTIITVVMLKSLVKRLYGGIQAS